MPSHALCTPSGPHHMLPEVLSLDTGSSPPGMTVPLQSTLPHLPAKSTAPVLTFPSGPTPASWFPLSCPSQMGGHPSPLPPGLYLSHSSLNAMVSSSTARWSFACSVNIQGEATWYWERVWAPESDRLVSLVISDPWQGPLTSTGSPVIDTAPATWGC